MIIPSFDKSSTESGFVRVVLTNLQGTRVETYIINMSKAKGDDRFDTKVERCISNGGAVDDIRWGGVDETCIFDCFFQSNANTLEIRIRNIAKNRMDVIKR